MYRKIIFLLISVVISGLIFMSCSDDGGTTTPPSTPSCKIVSPNGGEILQMGSSVLLRFESDLTEDVAMYLYKNGDSLAVIDPAIAVDDSLEWYIPTTLEVGTDYQIKIVSTTDPSKYDFSDGNFTIAPAGNYIIVTSPNGGGIWLKGSTKQITWYDNIPGGVNVFLLKNGVPVDDIFGTPQASDGTQGWTIPDDGSYADGADYSIQIVSVDNPAVNDTSDFFFCLATNDNTQNIVGDWDINYFWKAGPFRADFSTDLTWKYIEGTDTLTGTWNMSGNGLRFDFDDYNTYYLGIVDRNDMEGTMRNASGSNEGTWNGIRIIPELYTPNGGDVWMRGTTQTITWDPNISGNVVLSLADINGIVQEIATVSGALGTYDWAIPTTVEPGADYLIRIAKEINGEALDQSDAFICISEDTLIDVVGDWVWNFYWDKSTTSLTFNANGTCSNGYGETGTWMSSGNGIKFGWGGDWYFMGLVNGDKMEGTQYQPPSSTGVWDANRILQVVTPNGGNFFQASEIVAITWYETLSAAEITIDLYENDLFYRNLGTVNVNNYTSFNWTIPTDIVTSTKYKIRMTSTTSDIYDESDGYFTISATASTPAIEDEDFEDGVADNWTALEGTWAVDTGLYTVTSGTLTQSSTISSFEVTGNYVYEARMKKTAGESYYYGLVFNGGDTTLSAGDGWWQNSSIFVIRTDGYFGMWTYDNGAWPVSTGYQYSSAVNTGLDVWNTLKIIVNNDTGDHHLFINDQYIQTVNSTYYSGGKIGLAVYDSGLIGAGAVDWVKVSHVNKSEIGEIENILINKDINKGTPVNR